jgi:NAD(P)-dependent dehydrogenase (short-subunit alcohol dehydrogenase family)
MSDQRLKGKVSIITGSGKGIGRAEAILFASEGSKIVVADTNTESGIETVKMIKDKGGEAVFFQVDITKTEEVKALIEFCVNTYGKLNVLVNNAGIHLGGRGDTIITETSEEVFDKVINVDLKGSFLCCKYAIKQMLKNGGGAIVNTGSVAATRGRAITSYGIAKAGVLALTRNIAVSYATENIRCNTLSPGSVLTDMNKASNQSKEAMDARIEKVPMKRNAQPEEQAYAALFLASDESSFMTGENMIVDGGELAGPK